MLPRTEFLDFFFFQIQHFHDGGPYYIETSPLICFVNQWTDFYVIGISVMQVNGLKLKEHFAESLLFFQRLCRLRQEVAC